MKLTFCCYLRPPLTDAGSRDPDPPGRDAELLIEAKYYTNPVKLSTGREFLGLRSDVSARHKVFVATLGSGSVVSLLSGKSVPHDVGVLPGRRGRSQPTQPDPACAVRPSARTASRRLGLPLASLFLVALNQPAY